MPQLKERHRSEHCKHMILIVFSAAPSFFEGLGGVFRVDVAEECHVGRQRLEAKVGVLEREHDLLEQNPVADVRQVQAVPSRARGKNQSGVLTV
jgi:hypothetical protein